MFRALKTGSEMTVVGSGLLTLPPACGVPDWPLGVWNAGMGGSLVLPSPALLRFLLMNG